MIAKTFIHRPVLAIVVSILITLVGLLALPQMAVSQFPDLAPPTVLVVANYPGADSETVEKTVATQIEQAVNGVENMIFMQSKSSNGGSYELTVSFEIGTNVDIAAVEVQNRVAQANPNLPEEVVRNGITVSKQSNQMLLLASLTSPNGTYDRLYLSNYASINLIDTLSRVPGVGKAENAGGAPYSMRVWVDPSKLRFRNLTSNDVINAIREQNLQAPAGSIGKPPQREGLAFQYSVTARGQLDTAELFNEIMVNTGTGTPVYLNDVARVELGAQSYDSFGRGNGKDEVPILVYQRPGANALAVAQGVEAELRRMEKNFPDDMKIEVTYDSTIAVEGSVEAVIKTLVEAFLLVVLVVFTFLGSFRATLIPLIAIPVSLLGTFAVLFALGFSINTLTMFGMVLAIGIVVDDAIVVVEAVEHHIAEGMTPLAATEKAMDEVSGPVVAIALVLCSVFVPVAFLGGVTGELYRQFAVTLSASVVLSAVVALTLTPALCQKLLRPRQPMKGPFGWYLAAFESVFQRVVGVYGKGVALVVRRSFLALVTLVLVGGSIAALHKQLPTGFIPEEDSGYLLVATSLPPGSSMERTDAAAKEIETILLETPGVSMINMIGGVNFLSGARGSSYATAFIILEPWSQRKTPELSAMSIANSLNGRFSQLMDSQTFVVNPPAVPGLGLSGGFTFELQDRSGKTPVELDQVAQQFLGQGYQQPNLVGLFSSFSTSVPQVLLDIDRKKARTLGVRLNDLFDTLQVNLDGMFVNFFNRFGRTWRVYVQAESDFRRTPDDIGGLDVRSVEGGMVPVSNLAEPKMVTGPDMINRYNLYRSAEIFGGAAPGVSSGQAIAQMEQLAESLPEGYGYEWTGTAYQEKQSSGQQNQILLLALLFVFLFLAAQYESWTVPFSVLLGLPTGVLGAYLGTWMAGLDSNVYVQIGIITLMGLASKNAILIVEFAKEKHEREGMPLAEAALEGALLRFRPILMTSFAFILGVLPLIFASGAGAAGQKALGVAVVSGMTVATLLGVFLIPALYCPMLRPVKSVMNPC